MVKVGVEWDLFEPHPWDVGVSVAWDAKEGYDAFTLGITIGRLWG